MGWLRCELIALCSSASEEAFYLNSTMGYSAALLWECTKKDSCFLRKPSTPNQPWMSADPQNLTGVNSFKFSGLTGGKVLGLSTVKKGAKESIVLSTAGKKALKPKVRMVETGLAKSTKKGLAALESAVAGKFYRKDLLQLAQAKYVKIKTSLKKK